MNKNFSKILFNCCFVFLFGLTSFLSAQQTPELGHYAFYPDWFNPASVGADKVTAVNLAYRQQWLGIDQAPNVQHVSFETALFDKQRNGLGFFILNENVHISRRTQLVGQYAFHILPEGAHRLSLGLYAGLISQGLDFTDTKISSFDDLTLYDNKQTQSHFDAGAGFYYSFISDFTIVKLNLSTTQLPGMVKFKANDYDLETHFRAGLSWRIMLGSGFHLEPVVSYTDRLRSPAFDEGQASALLRLHLMDEAFWIGGGLRTGNSAYLGAFGFRMGQENNLALSGIYEIPTGQSALAKPSFEVALGVSFGSKKTKKLSEENPCPVDRKAYWEDGRKLNKQINTANELAENCKVKSIPKTKGLQLVYTFDEQLDHYDISRNYKVTNTLQQIDKTLTDLMDECKAPNFKKVESINVSISLQISDSELNFGTFTKYNGEYGVPFEAVYFLNGRKKVSDIEKGIISNEELVLLKANEIKQYFIQNLEVAESFIDLNIYTDNYNLDNEAVSEVLINLSKE